MNDCAPVVHQAVVKAMELLALEGKIKEKTYGKQKIYFADQVSLFNLRCCAAKVTHAQDVISNNPVCFRCN